MSDGECFARFRFEALNGRALDKPLGIHDRHERLLELFAESVSLSAEIEEWYVHGLVVYSLRDSLRRDGYGTTG